jgi:hypothetical protein
MLKTKWAPARGFSRGLSNAHSVFFLLLSIVVFPFFQCGCASPGEPLERKPPTPLAITDLAAEQSGDDVVLTFTVPKETVEHRELKQALAIEIYRDFEAAPASGAASAPRSDAAGSPTLLVTIPPAMVNQYAVRGKIRYADSITAEDFANNAARIVRYVVRTRASAKKSSADSNAASLRIYPAPDPIEDLTVGVANFGIALTWTPPQKTLTGSQPPIVGYRIYRGESETNGGSSNANSATAVTADAAAKLISPLLKIGENESPSFQDTHFEFGKTYVYSVRSFAQYGDAKLESADSKLVEITPRDIFPPTAPQGLVAVLVPAQGNVPAHIELSWAVNPETDVAGYNVYRSEQANSSGTRLNTELLLTPVFRDMNTVPGRHYLYTITAVDRAGNESRASAAVSGGVSAESQATP